MGLQSILGSPHVSPIWLDIAVARIVERSSALLECFGRFGPLELLAALKTESRAHGEGENRSDPDKIGWSGSEELLARFQRSVIPELDAAYNFARFLSRDPDAAQDIVQNAFLRAYRGFDGYRGGDIRAWILMIVRNCYHDWLSERRRRVGVEVDIRRGSGEEADDGLDEIASDDDTPEAALMRKTESGTIRLVLGKLPSSLREVLVLREIENFSYRQIAEIADIPIGTVMSRLARARQEFGRAWQKEAYAREMKS